jgi:membrane protein implicated in regulation of membrane protease activity
METIYLICFFTGLALSILSVIGGFGHLHIGHLHIGHAHTHPTQHGLSSINGFTITAFLAWFGGAGYLLHRVSIFPAVLVLILAVISGIAGAALLWAVLFKILLPRERVLTAEETEMPGVIAHVSDSIRDSNSIGEIIFSQTGTRRATAARSIDGTPIPRGTEVVVLRYERGIAYVRTMHDADELNPSP